MRLTITAITFIGLTATAYADDWAAFKLNKHQAISEEVSSCMAYKTLDIIEGTGALFAERFYAKCIKNVNSSGMSYSRTFKQKTIGRFLYIVRRAAMYHHSMRA